MSFDFMNAVKAELDTRRQLTENGAVGFATSGHALLDMNFKVASYRSKTEDEILRDYIKAYAEDPELALKWLFYTGDVREGLGERRLFRVISKAILPSHKNLIPYIAEYNRWDSIFELIGTDAEDTALKIVAEQLMKDIAANKEGKAISLLAKWMPSINTSSKDARRLAGRLANEFGMTPRVYRKTLSKLRAALNVVEQKTCAGQWADINYEAVPSQANLKYKNAFLKHDEERRREFLSKLSKGEVKINSAVTFPHDIVHRYIGGIFSSSPEKMDETLEGMWKALPKNMPADKQILVVRDGSGSMRVQVGKTQISALEVATALSIYCAEQLKGPFNDKFVTFSNRPQLIDMSKLTTLCDKLRLCYSNDDCTNTNIEATFDLVLKVAIDNKLKQEEIPTLLIISDMEFDSCACCQYADLFDAIKEKFASHGYSLPRLIFWNVNSRTCTVPVQENELGVALVSGFSSNIVKLVESNNLDPYEILKETLGSERYAQIKMELYSPGQEVGGGKRRRCEQKKVKIIEAGDLILKEPYGSSGYSYGNQYNAMGWVDG